MNIKLTEYQMELFMEVLADVKVNQHLFANKSTRLKDKIAMVNKVLNQLVTSQPCKNDELTALMVQVHMLESNMNAMHNTEVVDLRRRIDKLESYVIDLSSQIQTVRSHILFKNKGL